MPRPPHAAHRDRSSETHASSLRLRSHAPPPRSRVSAPPAKAAAAGRSGPVPSREPGVVSCACSCVRPPVPHLRTPPCAPAASPPSPLPARLSPSAASLARCGSSSFAAGQSRPPRGSPAPARIRSRLARWEAVGPLPCPASPRRRRRGRERGGREGGPGSCSPEREEMRQETRGAPWVDGGGDGKPTELMPNRAMPSPRQTTARARASERL
ncbi:hypothetical protein PVAP13_2KG071616 [Panicum virgatum]|uniref:Uncharacterized protein n=1 Tax=Panicum virgatum TaxID=38727 RepID=A0A8T0VYF3_PANVG|nr:hypothetical protein PVAP13_2KG071616 [Panicum virgatum]